jgi:hypothetical protein
MLNYYFKIQIQHNKSMSNSYSLNSDVFVFQQVFISSFHRFYSILYYLRIHMLEKYTKIRMFDI